MDTATCLPRKNPAPPGLLQNGLKITAVTCAGHSRWDGRRRRARMADLCTPAHTAFWLIGISRTGEPGTRRRLLSATSMVLPSVTMPGFRAVAGPCGGAVVGVVPR